MENLDLILYISLGFLLASTLLLIINKGLFRKQTDDKGNSISIEDNALIKGKLEAVQEQLEQLKIELRKQREENTRLKEQLARKETEIETLVNSESDLKLMHKKLNKEFEAIANRVVLQNVKELGNQHQKHLDTILHPFKESIHNFEKKVEEVYDKELRDKLSLREELSKLLTLNQNLSADAQNLTEALKGDNKKQGNWGELILERVLESSGLRNGEEYKLQYSTSNENNQLIQPDVVVFLPEKKHLIIDSKVSLLAYEKYISASSDEDRDIALKAHIISLKNHIKSLSNKNYQKGIGLDSPDFVLLFVPIESSFSLALKNDVDLFHFAWSKKIVLVSPTTLLATLRTIASVWKQEKQTKNVMEIARLGGTLYDKFVGFIQDMEKIEKGLNDSQAAYNNAIKKLTTGKGNISTTAQKIRSLGAKVNKQIPDKYVE